MLDCLRLRLSGEERPLADPTLGAGDAAAELFRLIMGLPAGEASLLPIGDTSLLPLVLPPNEEVMRLEILPLRLLGVLVRRRPAMEASLSHRNSG